MHRLHRLLPITLLLLLAPWPGRTGTPSPPASLPIAAERSGTGTVDLVLVPGLSGGDVSWEETATRLSSRYRVHRIQLTGLESASADVASVRTIDGFAGALVAYLQHNARHPVVLIGHSAGGVASMLVAIRQPRLVERLVIVDALPFMSANRGDTRVDDDLRGRIAAEARDMLGQDAAAFESRMCEQASSAVGSPDVAIRIAQGGMRSDRKTYAALYESLSITDLRNEIGRLRSPPTVIFADQSPLGAPAGHMLRRYQAQYAGSQARLVEIKDARHYVMLDQPGDFAHALDSALID